MDGWWYPWIEQISMYTVEHDDENEAQVDTLSNKQQKWEKSVW